MATGAYTNGSAEAGSVARMRIAVAHDPLYAVERLGAKAGKAIAFALVAAMVLHGAAAARATLIPLELLALGQSVRARVYSSLIGQIDVEVEKPVETPKEKEPEPEPEPVKEEAKPEPEPAVPPPPTTKAPEPTAEREPPPPAAAQAAAVLTSDPDPDEPVDLTNTIVTGTGTTFAGGVTQQGGTSTTAVRNANARAWGTGNSTGRPEAPPAPPSGPDRSRVAGLDGAANWNCPWPSEADAAQIDEAVVTVRVAVRADGTASKVDVLSDPGNGFGREARNCALRRKNYKVALDREGNPVAGETKPFNIRFERD
jgi:protein TonB